MARSKLPSAPGGFKTTLHIKACNLNASTMTISQLSKALSLNASATMTLLSLGAPVFDDIFNQNKNEFIIPCHRGLKHFKQVRTL